VRLRRRRSRRRRFVEAMLGRRDVWWSVADLSLEARRFNPPLIGPWGGAAPLLASLEREAIVESRELGGRRQYRVVDPERLLGIFYR
jgi:hypothetical protein